MALQEIWCARGEHYWTRTPRKGQPPAMCVEHAIEAAEEKSRRRRAAQNMPDYHPAPDQRVPPTWKRYGG